MEVNTCQKLAVIVDNVSSNKELKAVTNIICWDNET